MNKATPRPWIMRQSLSPVDGAYYYAISSNDVRVLAEAFGRSSTGEFIDAEANAALIVKAVNSHDQLVEVCEALISVSDDSAGMLHYMDVNKLRLAVSKAREALKSAKGEA